MLLFLYETRSSKGSRLVVLLLLGKTLDSHTASLRPDHGFSDDR